MMRPTNRRSFLKGLGAWDGNGDGNWAAPSARAFALPEDKIKAVHYFTNPGDAQGRQGQPMVNQSTNVVMIETERGLVGIGEGGEPRTMEECASMLIGLDPFRIDNLWQRMMRGYFYPAGREKLHSLGALDLALWDLKGKALDVPVWQLLGGKSRNHVELYSTVFPTPRGGTLEDAARACLQAGFRTYRYATDNPRERVVDRFKLVRKMYDDCVLLHKGAGDGGWAIDFHTELDPPDAINLATMLEPLHPYFCEDLIRSENVTSYEHVRQRTRVPIAVGEQFGYKWDINQLIEKRADRLHARDAAQRRRHQRVHEDHRAGGDALHRNDSALHRSHLRSGAGELPDRDFDHGVDGDVGRRQPHMAILAEGLRLQGREAVAERPAGPGRDGGYEPS